MDDWERAYEEDRQRLAMGQEIAAAGRRGAADTDPFAEKKPPQPQKLSPAMFGDGAAPPTPPPPAPAPAPVQPPAAAAPPREESRGDEAELEKFYAHYGDGPAAPHRSLPDGAAAAPSDALHDSRFGLRCLAAGWNLSSLFGPKMGRRLYFAEAPRTTFKGFLSSKEAVVACLVTPNCVYLGDVETGALVVCVDIARLFEVYVFADAAVGLRTRDALEVHLQTQQHTRRLVETLQKIAAHWRVDVRVVEADAAREKTFRKEMRLVDKASHSWPLAEDPRTGLRVVGVTEHFVSILAAVTPKILHWFGGVQQPGYDWKRARTRHRRCAWVTATCLFVAKAEGPGGDGRGIKHCAAMEYMTELILGPGGELGIVAGDGPPQPPIHVIFDSAEERDGVVFILQECHSYRRRPQGGAIPTTRVESVEGRMRTEGAADARPQLFLMRPRKELYDFLRGPVKSA